LIDDRAAHDLVAEQLLELGARLGPFDLSLGHAPIDLRRSQAFCIAQRSWRIEVVSLTVIQLQSSGPIV